MIGITKNPIGLIRGSVKNSFIESILENPFKDRCRDSCYVVNDKFTVLDKAICLSKIGEVAMPEPLRLT